MKNCVWIIVCAIALVGAPRDARADRITPPPVPTTIEAPDGTRAFFRGHAIGSQNYVCLPSTKSPTGMAWTLFGPQATLVDDDAKQLVTHFLSANPYEAGTPRATWLHSSDSSRVWAAMVRQSSDPLFVASGSIPWFLLQVFGAQNGPDGGDKLTAATYIQRVNTLGGLAPAVGCAQTQDIGRTTLVPYEADYFFFKRADEGSQ